jgi:hypothetical protein
MDSDFNEIKFNKKSNKFKEIASIRVSNAIKNIRLTSNLANKRNYVYTEEQYKKIVRALQDEVSELKKRFEKEVSKDLSNNNNKKVFSLDD